MSNRPPKSGIKSGVKSDEKFPALAHLFLWIDRPWGPRLIFWGLIAVCAVLLGLAFTYKNHAEVKAENIQGFFAVFGFVGFTCLILLAKGLRVLIKREEDYYGDKAIDSEAYPEAELGREEYHAD